MLYKLPNILSVTSWKLWQKAAAHQESELQQRGQPKQPLLLPERKTLNRNGVKMALSNERKSLYLLLFLVGIWFFSYAIHGVSAQATDNLIAIGEERSFRMVFYNFVLFYVVGSMLAYASFHFMDIFKVKYLSRPLQITCAFEIAIHMMGAIGYVGMWNETFFAQCQALLISHYNALIALINIQILLFVNFWTNQHVGHIDRFTTHYWSGHNNWMPSDVRIKAK